LREDRDAYFAVGSLQGFDLDVIDSDHLSLKTHDGHQSLDQDGVLRTFGRLLLLKLEAVRQSHRLHVSREGRIFLSVFTDLLRRNRWGKRRHFDWVERHAVKLEAVVLGCKLHHKIVLNALFPDRAILVLTKSEGTGRAVKFDGLRLLSEGRGIERRGLVVGDFEREEEGVGGQRQGGC